MTEFNRFLINLDDYGLLFIKLRANFSKREGKKRVYRKFGLARNTKDLESLVFQTGSEALLHTFLEECGVAWRWCADGSFSCSLSSSSVLLSLSQITATSELLKQLLVPLAVIRYQVQLENHLRISIEPVSRKEGWSALGFQMTCLSKSSPAAFVMFFLTLIRKGWKDEISKIQKYFPNFTYTHRRYLVIHSKPVDGNTPNSHLAFSIFLFSIYIFSILKVRSKFTIIWWKT